MQTENEQRVLILGGGFAGVNTALRLEKLLRKRSEVKITLVNRENYSLFTPMLSEVAGGGIEPRHIVNPIRSYLKRTEFREGVVKAIDLGRKVVETEHPQSHEGSLLGYDRLVIALGSVTNYRGLPGVAENSFALKTMRDGQAVRDHVLSVLEQAAVVESPDQRACMLTFVIAGGGFSGAELCGALDDFIDEVIKLYPSIDPDEVRMVLVHPGPRLLPEVGPELAEYARQCLTRSQVEVRLSTKVSRATDHSVTIGDDEEIPTHTLVWTAGTSPSPVLKKLMCDLDGRGAVVVDPYLEVPGWPGVFALGDCANVPDPRNPGTFYPPTAQHAIREAKAVAHNVAASLGMGEKKPFVYDSIGSLAVLGHRTAVAELKGMRFAGFPAWWMWRTVYWSKLPSMERRLRVATDWTLDLFFPPDTVQLGSGTIPHDELDHAGPEHHPEHSHHGERSSSNSHQPATVDGQLTAAGAAAER
jgi:NADH dehydrogenase